MSCDNIVHFVTDVVPRMGVYGKLNQCAMPILSSILFPCIIPLHVFWAVVLLIIIMLVFLVDVRMFSRSIVIEN